MEEVKDKISKEEENLKKELAEAQNKVKEYLNGWQRAQADYINREREIAKDKENWVKFANAGLVLQMLPIFDHLKQALNHLPGEDISNWTEGIKQIKSQFEVLLKNLGVEEIKTLGNKFNPLEHEVVAKEKTAEEDKKDIIIKEVQPGYRMYGEVIRPAKVVIGE